MGDWEATQHKDPRRERSSPQVQRTQVELAEQEDELATQVQVEVASIEIGKVRQWRKQLKGTLSMRSSQSGLNQVD